MNSHLAFFRFLSLWLLEEFKEKDNLRASCRVGAVFGFGFLPLALSVVDDATRIREKKNCVGESIVQQVRSMVATSVRSSMYAIVGKSTPK